MANTNAPFESQPRIPHKFVKVNSLSVTACFQALASLSTEYPTNAIFLPT